MKERMTNKSIQSHKKVHIHTNLSSQSNIDKNTFTCYGQSMEFSYRIIPIFLNVLIISMN
jgi:hypothetical protein